jgi:hypothetical protein
MPYPHSHLIGRSRRVVCAALAFCTSAVPTLNAKPISFADGFTFMHERDSEMIETDLYYAPKYWFSFGPTVSIARADDKLTRRESQVMHANFLLRRWNMTNAQGNLFASYGLGQTKTIRFSPDAAQRDGFAARDNRETVHHAVVQGDYETRQFYSSFKLDAHRTATFLDRTDTAQIGFSPYPHDYDDVALWFVGQVKKYRGLNDKTEGGAFVRVFYKNIWVELGMTEGRKSQMMLMINY